MIEEELYSDEDHSSVYTSEDDFMPDKNIQRRFKEKHPLIDNTEQKKTDQFDSNSIGIPGIPKLTIERMGTSVGQTTPLEANTDDNLRASQDDARVKKLSELGSDKKSQGPVSEGPGKTADDKAANPDEDLLNVN